MSEFDIVSDNSGFHFRVAVFDIKMCSSINIIVVTNFLGIGIFK